MLLGDAGIRDDDCFLQPFSAIPIFKGGFYDRERLRFNEQNLLFLTELSNEVKRLVPNNFMELYNTKRLPHIVRYLKAISLRIERAFIDMGKDQARASLIIGYTDKLNSFLENLSPCTTKEKRSEIEEFFWMIEEYKVSVFAQELKTVVPISPKRLDNLIKKIERMI